MKSSAYYVASSKVWLAHRYLHDLAEYRTGDTNRFGRMVDGKGSSCGSEQLWLKYLAAILARDDVNQYFAAEALAIATELAALGYKEQPPCLDLVRSAPPVAPKTP